jgi:hypothetical protein
MTKVTIVGLTGRVGRDSGNTAILKAALELLPENMELEIIDEEGVEQPETDARNWGVRNAILFDEEEIHTPENDRGTSFETAPEQHGPRNPRIILRLRQIDKPEERAGLAHEKSGLLKNADQNAVELIQGLIDKVKSWEKSEKRK